ncbi:macro domain-containing protein [Erysipelothrix aquatica]|uniref:macro domain-containing protein n=2 Tax=Erysipelothrix aquatica TaxID=2683714 RepID=UPI0019159E60|nr:macro domain-containing protein [Erysipelothrix aquatica]
MKIKKIKFFDKRIKTKFLEILGKLSTILSTILIFFGIPTGWEIISAGVFLVVLILIYFVIYFRANKLTEASIDIGGTTVSVKQGNIFEEIGLKVIPFNEYFDTIVDNKIISELSLNGKYIKNVNQDLIELDKQIENDIYLNSENNILEKNSKRKGNIGKKIKYKLGSSVVIDDYVLTAFSKFNDNNEAELTMTQYINFLLNFWDEINRVYAQKSVTVPIFGSGITRFKGGFNNIEINELLNIMLWTFRISETRFKYPAKLTIIIYGDLFNKINLFGLQEDVNYGI